MLAQLNGGKFASVMDVMVASTLCLSRLPIVKDVQRLILKQITKDLLIICCRFCQKKKYTRAENAVGKCAFETLEIEFWQHPEKSLHPICAHFCSHRCMGAFWLKLRKCGGCTKLMENGWYEKPQRDCMACEKKKLLEIGFKDKKFAGIQNFKAFLHNKSIWGMKKNIEDAELWNAGYTPVIGFKDLNFMDGRGAKRIFESALLLKQNGHLVILKKTVDHEDDSLEGETRQKVTIWQKPVSQTISLAQATAVEPPPKKIRINLKL